MSEFLGREYNYHSWAPTLQETHLFKQIAHPGDFAPDFTLTSVDGDKVTLSKLRGKPVVIEFGAIT